MMKQGQVKKFFTSKRTGVRVGFISVIGEPDVYFTEKTVEGPGYDALGINSPFVLLESQAGTEGVFRWHRA